MQRFGNFRAQGGNLPSTQKFNFSRTTGLQESAGFRIKHGVGIDKNLRGMMDGKIEISRKQNWIPSEDLAEDFGIPELHTDEALANKINKISPTATQPYKFGKPNKNDNLSKTQIEELRDREVDINVHKNKYNLQLNVNDIHTIQFSNKHSLAPGIIGIEYGMAYDMVRNLPQGSKDKFIAAGFKDSDSVLVANHLNKAFYK